MRRCVMDQATMANAHAPVGESFRFARVPDADERERARIRFVVTPLETLRGLTEGGLIRMIGRE